MNLEQDAAKKELLRQEIEERANDGDPWACAGTWAYYVGAMRAYLQAKDRAPEDWEKASELGRKTMGYLRCALPTEAAAEVEAADYITEWLRKIEAMVWTLEAHLPEEQREALARQDPLVRGNTDEGSIEGDWYCLDRSGRMDLHTFSAGGLYTKRILLGKDAGETQTGDWNRAGSSLTTTLLTMRYRPRNPEAVRGWLALTGDSEGVAELDRTGFTTRNIESPVTFRYEIEVREGSRLWFSRPFWPESAKENRGPQHEERFACDRKNLFPMPDVLPATEAPEGGSTPLLGSAIQPDANPASGSASTDAEFAAQSDPRSTDVAIDSRSAGSYARPAVAEVDLMDEFVAGSCTYRGVPQHVGTLRIDSLCNQVSQSNQRCRSFAVTFSSGKTLTNADIGIEPGADGNLPFIPAEPTFYEEEYGGDVYGRWVIRLLEWGGGKFAAERIRVFDDAGEPMSPLLEPSQFEKWKALRHIPDQGSFFESKVRLSEQCNE